MCSSIFRMMVSLAAGLCCATAHAVIVNIDAQQQGAASAAGGPNLPNVLPGATLTNIYTPKQQLTLAAGTYLITNADTSGYYSAWNFQGYPNTPNWVWSFIIADDATSKVLVDDYVSGVQPTQAAMAAVTGTTTYDGLTPLAATSTAGFQDTLTLAQSTTLDFLIDDYYLPDNGGGVSLSIQAVPEPTTAALLAIGSIGLLLARRRLSAG
jgi:PEP-CTERM motif